VRHCKSSVKYNSLSSLPAGPFFNKALSTPVLKLYCGGHHDSTLLQYCVLYVTGQASLARCQEIIWRRPCVYNSACLYLGRGTKRVLDDTKYGKSFVDRKCVTGYHDGFGGYSGGATSTDWADAGLAKLPFTTVLFRVQNGRIYDSSTAPCLS
jgi:hypothetical protein